MIKHLLKLLQPFSFFPLMSEEELNAVVFQDGYSFATRSLLAANSRELAEEALFCYTEASRKFGCHSPFDDGILLAIKHFRDSAAAKATP